MSKCKVIIAGGGPAGSVAALTLAKLGHDVDLYEKDTFPRYRVGESFLPGTMSILQRLGLQGKIDEAAFVKKPSATFLWGQDQAPWTFSFSTPRPAEWVFDHAIQVKREEFDLLLLDEARARGIRVHEGYRMTDVALSDPDKITIELYKDDVPQHVSADYLIDASGANSVLVKKLDLRRYDSFYKNLAVWSYFRCPQKFKGDLSGTTFSITFEDGWVWMIPLKGDLYSVGCVVDQSKSVELREKGPDDFYRTTLAKCRRAMQILGESEMVDTVRVTRDWSYDTKLFSRDRFFLSGDSACFTDPLFSQGVHLATQSAVCAAAAIDRLSQRPEEYADIHKWYNSSYGNAYEQYHEFLASFYTFASFTEPESSFWMKRRIAESDDERFERRQWFEHLVDKAKQGKGLEISEFRDRASTMIAIGRHQRQELSDEFSDRELTPFRIAWINKLTKQLNSLKKIVWNGDSVCLHKHYKVNPQSFVLENKQIIGDDSGRTMSKYPLDLSQKAIFDALKETPCDYKTLIRSLNESGAPDISSQVVVRLFEAGLITGYDDAGHRVHVQDRLRFDGVGVDYEV